MLVQEKLSNEACQLMPNWYHFGNEVNLVGYILRRKNNLKQEYDLLK